MVSHCARPTRGALDRALREHILILCISLKRSGRGCPSLRASSDHRFIVGALRARKAPGRSPPPLLNLRSSADYSLDMELPNLKDDPYLKVLRPLVETYLAFWRID